MPVPTVANMQFRRGLEADLPASAPLGQPLWTTDTHKLYIGTGTGIVLVAGGGGGGVTSLNALIGALGLESSDSSISITSSGTTIDLKATGSSSYGFADGEVAGGSGTAWTLANTPIATPQLFVLLPGFGLIGLVDGSPAGYGYNITGKNISTVTSYPVSSLIAWYRYAAIPSINFADGEVAGGSGTAWTLAHTPSAVPTVFALLPSFGLVGLVKGSASDYGYSITGGNITTVSSYATGSLLVWYRY